MTDATKPFFPASPAPWLVSKNTSADASAFPLCIRDSGSWSVCYLTGIENAELRHNAALIASAPVLRTQLQSVREWCFPDPVEVPTDKDARLEWYQRRLHLIANAALAGLAVVNLHLTALEPSPAKDAQDV